MKKINLAVILIASAALLSCETAPTSGSAKSKSVLARVTVYWTSSDHWTRRHQSSTGARLHTGVCAVDPRVIPYGSQVVFTDQKLVAIDTGTAVKNRRAARMSGRTPEERGAVVVDRFFETKRDAMKWANSHPLFQKLGVIYP
jgi:3D (Asp-Asp-Asp) domain-containing protein